MPDDGGEGVVAGGGTAREYILDEDECPLSILMNHPARCEQLPITVTIVQLHCRFYRCLF